MLLKISDQISLKFVNIVNIHVFILMVIIYINIYINILNLFLISINKNFFTKISFFLLAIVF